MRALRKALARHVSISAASMGLACLSVRAFAARLAAVLNGTGCSRWRYKRVNSEEEAYRRLFHRGYRPASKVDVGAYEGNWTRLARCVFPEA